MRKAARQAALWPRQNHTLLAVLLGFGFYVFLNWMTVCFVVPGLVKMLLGVETIFTRSPLSLLNTTFLAAMLSLTYLCVDPIVKSVYALRCFYGESLESGEDLKAELRRLALEGGSGDRHPVAAAILPAVEGGILPPGPAPAGTPPATARAALLLAALMVFVAAPARAAESTPPPAPKPAPAASAPRLSPPELDRAIQDVVQQTKYAWRMPREKMRTADADQPGIIGRFLQRVGDFLRREIKAFFEWLDKWLRKLSRSHRRESATGYGWIMLLEILLYALLAAVVAGLAILLLRLWRNWKRRKGPVAAQPIQPAPDLSDESLGAEQLPEDGWTKLARELLARGELRLAVRAFYFASLAHLAERNLISLAKFKSNRDYERELRRRGHSFPDVLALFGENVLVIDRTWYGLHQVSGEQVSRFAGNVERIKAGG